MLKIKGKKGQANDLYKYFVIGVIIFGAILLISGIIGYAFFRNITAVWSGGIGIAVTAIGFILSRIRIR